MAAQAALASGGVLVLDVPPYRNDVALKAERSAASLPAPPPVATPTPWHDALLRTVTAAP